jgi:hypothetical protein
MWRRKYGSRAIGDEAIAWGRYSHLCDLFTLRRAVVEDSRPTSGATFAGTGIQLPGLLCCFGPETFTRVPVCPLFPRHSAVMQGAFECYLLRCSRRYVTTTQTGPDYESVWGYVLDISIPILCPTETDNLYKCAPIARLAKKSNGVTPIFLSRFPFNS